MGNGRALWSSLIRGCREEEEEAESMLFRMLSGASDKSSFGLYGIPLTGLFKAPWCLAFCCLEVVTTERWISLPIAGMDLFGMFYEQKEEDKVKEMPNQQLAPPAPRLPAAPSDPPLRDDVSNHYDYLVRVAERAQEDGDGAPNMEDVGNIFVETLSIAQRVLGVEEATAGWSRTTIIPEFSSGIS